MQFTAFDTSDELARWLAREVAARLSAAIGSRGRALLAVSGGSTPVRFFRALSSAEIDWHKVWVTLADERFVPPNSTRSNQRLVTVELLQGRAAKAHFIPLFSDGGIDAAARDAEEALKAQLPIDVLVLGMGKDGHTASLFPGAEGLAEASRAEGKRQILPIVADAAGEPRLTLTLAAIAASHTQFLHLEGQEKRAVFEQA